MSGHNDPSAFSPGASLEQANKERRASWEGCTCGARLPATVYQSHNDKRTTI